MMKMLPIGESYCCGGVANGGDLQWQSHQRREKFYEFGKDYNVVIMRDSEGKSIGFESFEEAVEAIDIFSSLSLIIVVYPFYCGSLEPMPMPASNGGVAHALFVSKDRRIP
ncbi:hypothetical protein HHK36_002665 [Tetracentron sinense]|uniref:Uncharacterized protein n=1 Tax=Tetracentron sinense TaxID=13715 RepID=A0A835DMZ1_TETSI|nr:hypothetical protein HHK36_002665 [Tetracentron sinense]